MVEQNPVFQWRQRIFRQHICAAYRDALLKTPGAIEIDHHGHFEGDRPSRDRSVGRRWKLSRPRGVQPERRAPLATLHSLWA